MLMSEQQDHFEMIMQSIKGPKHIKEEEVGDKDNQVENMSIADFDALEAPKIVVMMKELDFIDTKCNNAQ